MNPAPLYGDHSIREFAICEYLSVDPLTQLRVAKWMGGSRGTVHIFNGRTEYIEKYYDVIESFITRGFNVTAHDWRGQGLSTRNEEYPTRCHVMDFDEHQSDARAVMSHFSDMPGPHYLFCHSMGGAIGTRFMAENDNVKAAIFSAPMYGIKLPPLLEFFRPLIFKLMKTLGLQWSTAPGTKDVNYELHTRFKNNLLTNHKPSWDKMVQNVKEDQDLQCGGPTYYWSEAAYKEIDALSKIKSIDTPALMTLGTNENVVSPQAIYERMKIQDNWRLLELKNGRHEGYVETDEIRKELWLNIDLFLDQYS